jgi:hypothetical protein
MIWLRSIAALILGGCLSFSLSCAGDLVISSRTPEAPSSRVMNLKPGPDLPIEGGAPLSRSESLAFKRVQAGATAVALRPVPTSVRALSTILAGLFAGYVAAVIAGYAAAMFGALTAWPQAVITGGLLFVTANHDGAWTAVALVALAVASGGLGGWWQGRNGRQKSVRGPSIESPNV